MSVIKIVLTGGPCAGKTTALAKTVEYFANHSETKTGVVLLPEAATEIIDAGLEAGTHGLSRMDFQSALLNLQIAREKIYEEAAAKLDYDNVVLICDRGTMDNKAFLTPEEFRALAESVGSDEVRLRDRYDAVIHMVTSAKENKDVYEKYKSSNPARTETPDEAKEQDDRLISVWTGHPHLRVVSDLDFDKKIKAVIAEINGVLGIPEPLETERKFLIEYPDTGYLESLPNCRKIEILQTYLKTDDGSEKRVRQRGENGSYIFIETVKTRISDLVRTEKERLISPEEYNTLLMQSDPERRPIRKTRYCLTYENQYFEIDVYPFWTDKAICELELSHEDQEIIWPGFLNVIREVTEEEEFKNHSLAKLQK